MSDASIAPVSLHAVEEARNLTQGIVRRTPLIHFPHHDPAANIHLKLENLQSIGSFKIRGASHAMALMSPDQLREGATTASMGNMAQGVAWNARRLGIPCLVVVPENAPEAKINAIHHSGAHTRRIPFADWWQILMSGDCPDALGVFIHPVCDPAVIAGHAVIGLEILEDLPNVDAVLIPFGGGGLALGIASAIKAIRPQTSVYAVEPETANPLQRSWAEGKRVPAPYEATFVDGCGGASVLPQMWPALRQVLDGALDVSLAETAEAIRALASRGRIVAEGAGAVSLAAARAARYVSLWQHKNIACIVSGGNINLPTLARILHGETPR
ncbi:MAG: pyridoxal-phosphate dependent enzyme [Anaerolineaceae bacterium]|nr:pyridoxal-phosphate dependent enzyme [Anaerolineaceae bacterium]